MWRILAAKIFLVVGLLISPAANAQVIVNDPTALVESITQTANQVRQLQYDLQQYQLLLQNTNKLDSYTWLQAQDTMNLLIQKINTLDDLNGGLNSYLDIYKDQEYYSSSSCLSSMTGCTAADVNNLRLQQQQASEAQNNANDALYRNIEQQQNDLKSQAATLSSLQGRATTANGQMEALGYANQFAGMTVSNLQEMRASLVAQQNAEAARNQIEADRMAREQAASQSLRRGEFVKSPSRSW